MFSFRKPKRAPGTDDKGAMMGEGLSGKRKEMDGVYIIFSDPFFSSNRIAYKTQSILFFFFQKKKGCFARFRFFPSLGFRVVGSKQRRGGGYQLSPRKKGPMPMPSHAVGENSPPREFHRLASHGANGKCRFGAGAVSCCGDLCIFIASSILGLTSYRNALSTKLPWGFTNLETVVYKLYTAKKKKKRKKRDTREKSTVYNKPYSSIILEAAHDL